MKEAPCGETVTCTEPSDARRLEQAFPDVLDKATQGPRSRPKEIRASIPVDTRPPTSCLLPWPRSTILKTRGRREL